MLIGLVHRCAYRGNWTRIISSALQLHKRSWRTVRVVWRTVRVVAGEEAVGGGEGAAEECTSPGDPAIHLWGELQLTVCRCILHWVMEPLRAGVLCCSSSHHCFLAQGVEHSLFRSLTNEGVNDFWNHKANLCRGGICWCLVPVK